MVIKLYILKKNAFVADYAYGDEVDCHLSDDQRRCRACGEVIGGREWLPPFRIRLRKGVRTNRPGDVIFGIFEDIIASERFREVWEEAILNGIMEWRPVEIVGPKSVGMKMKYYYPRFKEATAKPDFNKTKVAWNERLGPPTCSVCMSSGKNAINGIYLKEDLIPEDDLFHSLGLTELLASVRFKEVVEASGLTNIELVPAEQYVWDPLKKIK